MKRRKRRTDWKFRKMKHFISKMIAILLIATFLPIWGLIGKTIRAVEVARTIFEKGQGYEIVVDTTSVWADGYTADIIIRNTGNQIIKNWSIAVELDGEIQNVWNAVCEKKKHAAVFSYETYNREIEPEGQASFGIQVSGSQPEGIRSMKLTEATSSLVDQYKIDYEIKNQWENHAIIEAVIENVGEKPLRDWIIQFNLEGNITNLWNAEMIEKSSSSYSLLNKGYNADILPGEKISIGFQVEYEQGQLNTIPKDSVLIAVADENALYESDENFIYAFGNVLNNVLTIEWNTNIKSEKYNIYESKDHENFKLLDTVEKCNKYNLNIAENYDVGYYYVETNGYKSLEFKVSKIKDKIYVDEQDNDKDRLPDALELIFGSKIDCIDSDGDGLSDYEEVVIVGTNPLKKDSNDNSIDDYNDDIDKDGLTNGLEISIGTNPSFGDTDMDDLGDYYEVNQYKTNPLLKDTDGDKACDGWELENKTNPLIYDESFYAECSTGEVSEDDPVGARVVIETGKIAPQSLKIERVFPHDNVYITPTVAGYISNGFEFTVDGTFDEAKINFYYDETLGEISETFQPRIYYFNEETKMFEELENQVVEDYNVSAITSHFSTYVLLNKVEFDKVWNNDIKASAKDNNINVSLVVDLSGSMRGDKLETTKAVINSFIDELKDKDESALISFNDCATLRCSFTSNKDVVKTAVKQMSAGGLTSIYTGIKRSLEEFKKKKTDSYKIMIVFTDGYDEPSTTYEQNYKKLVEIAKEENVIIYTIGIGTIDKILLTRIAEETGGIYYYANVVSGLKEKLEEVQGETESLTKDSNGDGITDYYTEKIKNGEMVLSNSSKELEGIDFNKNSFGVLSDDWDSDGLKNGEEIKVVTENGRTYLKMFSHPMRVHSDLDAIDDYTEIQQGANPLVSSILYTPADNLMNNAFYAYEAHADNIRGSYSNFIDYCAVTDGVYDKHKIYMRLLIDYYSTCASENVIDATYIAESKKTNYDLLNTMLCNANSYYSKAEDINLLISFVNSITDKSILENTFRNKVSTFILEYNNLNQERLKLSIYANSGEEYFIKDMVRGQSDKIAKTISGVSNVVIVAKNVGEIYKTLQKINSIFANNVVFMENMDALLALSGYMYSNRDIANAAYDVKKCIEGEYLNILIANLKRGIWWGAIDASSIGLMEVPYINVIIATSDLLIGITGVQEEISQLYRMLCYSDLSATYIRLFKNIAKAQDSSRYYEIHQSNISNAVRYLSNIAQLRILGEKEQYYFAKYDGLFGGLINLLNNSEEVKKNTNSTIKFVRNLVELLNIELADEIKCEV